MSLTRFLSHLFGKIVEVRSPYFLSFSILRTFVRLYRPNLNESSLSLTEFRSLADFFTRDLTPSSRPIGAAPVCPVDGALRSCGLVAKGKLEQVKGRDYSLAGFLQDEKLASKFQKGHYFNFYLSPKDCHHIFSPVAGTVTSLAYIPGALFPVNDFSVRNIQDLFLKNERLITRISTEVGEVLVVMVGAFNVGKLYSAFSQAIGRDSRAVNLNAPISAGEKLGTFGLGSSVVVIFENSFPENGLALREGQSVRYGESLLR